MRGNADVAAHDLQEIRVAPGGPGGGEMTDQPERQPGDPQTQAETDGGRERAVEDGERARRPREQNRLGQGAVHGHLETGNGLAHISAPPAKEKNERKNEDAANAME